jgi:hypothetical protein
MYDGGIAVQSCRSSGYTGYGLQEEGRLSVTIDRNGIFLGLPLSSSANPTKFTTDCRIAIVQE